MDWSSSDAPQALKKFKNLCELYFSGPLKDKSEEEQVSYLLIWSGEEGIELVSKWLLSADAQKKLSKYWEEFAEYVAPPNNFRLLVTECKYTNPDEHIIDALIFGSNNPCVQSKLLEHDSTLTLDRMMSIARKQEATSNQLQDIRGSQQTTTIDALKQHGRHPRHRDTNTNHPPAQGFQDAKCGNCGTFHNPSGRLCPAYGTKCENCLNSLRH